jgi:hypothetical protein
LRLGIAAQKRAEFSQVFCGHARVRGQHERNVDGDRNARKIPFRVERQPFRKSLRD